MVGNRILIVDDDPDIREVLTVLLESEYAEVKTAGNGKDAVKMVREDNNIDLVILDVMMPEMSGVEACVEIRKFSKVPILFLTAKSREQDKVEGYTKGGDDYLVKPFSQMELLMKIKSLLRRYKDYQGKKTSGGTQRLTGNIEVDARKHAVIKDGKSIFLTDKEFGILQFFLDNRGKVVSNNDIYEGVWGGDYTPSDGNKVMVHILNLRKKLENDVNKPQLIKTVWGKGYKVD